MYDLTLFIECPYCGNKQEQTIRTENRNHTGKQVLFCGDIQDGCGKYFVAEVDMEPKIETQKIVGEESNNE